MLVFGGESEAFSKLLARLCGGTLVSLDVLVSEAGKETSEAAARQSG